MLQVTTTRSANFLSFVSLDFWTLLFPFILSWDNHLLAFAPYLTQTWEWYRPSNLTPRKKPIDFCFVLNFIIVRNTNKLLFTPLCMLYLVKKSHKSQCGQRKPKIPSLQDTRDKWQNMLCCCCCCCCIVNLCTKPWAHTEQADTDTSVSHYCLNYSGQVALQQFLFYFF